MRVKKWFTLVEVVVVVTIMWIVLSMTVLFGADYLKDLQLRTEKEALLNKINYTLSYVKSTNYYEWEQFAYIDVLLFSSWTTTLLDSWGLFGENIELVRSTLILSGTSDTIRIIPYSRSCLDVENGQDIISFDIQSSQSDDEFCFERDMRLCKVFVVACS